VLVSLGNPKATGRLNQAPVTVTITTGSVSDALVVPVTALLAQAGGGYAVEVIGAGGRHRLVAVTPGVFDDAAGLVQVTGPGLAAGQHVVVPAT
jgi:multidrug efflux pump subunit AcrA (membrane-fusion protein)